MISVKLLFVIRENAFQHTLAHVLYGMLNVMNANEEFGIMVT